MKILVVSAVGEHFKGRFIVDALRRLGHEVEAVDDWNYGFERYGRLTAAIRFAAPRVPAAHRLLRRRVARAFETAMRRMRPDLVLVTRGDRLCADALRASRSSGRPRLVLWGSDSPLRFPEMFAALPAYDDVFVKDSYLVEELSKYGLRRVHYLGQCCEPGLHRPVELSDDERATWGGGIAVVGSMYPERVALLESVAELPLRIWLDLPRLRLPSGSRLRPFVTGVHVEGPDQTKVFCASDLVLNTHHPQDVHGINLRTFEATACGACVLVDFKRDLQRFFADGEELIVYRTPAELVEKARNLLARPDERRRIGRAAHARAHREHTYDRRMAELLETISR